ncbi:iron-sulfur cluster carrier protein MrpORP [Desulforhabdus amnigena]|jgi:Mrp family chromosome partitioning ATPase/predicted Fe-Mo cluster-binding NifX family protein|uniref:Iron-sulfur cluster carrier protein n=1 Tax=Desulforhabdus amnigena TaxID=40218 RepID=A0A9W6FV51_9BACT|nr:iron-sulfur cluster carrier protein MrpORP [Desulforhabdus amnigena]GLI35495.1 iron-sulfur cluster carrier protein [Desulforhabdus amnigena]
MGSCQSQQCSHGAGPQEEKSKEDIQLDEQLKRIKHKLLVMSGKGGVGKSSVASYLAVGLSKLGYRVGLLDVDLHGPSIPGMLGLRGMFRVDPDENLLIPHKYNDFLQVVSIQCLLEDSDAAVIWRGPVKHGVIKQFIAEAKWGDLDFLLIDSPPGTGDEPLSVAQMMPDAKAVIVTTPQEVSLADVRKSINFCRKVNMPILGLVENMNGLICPHCNKEVPLFGKGGGGKMAEKMGVHLLGSLPFDPRVVESADIGKSLLEQTDDSPFLKALGKLIAEVVSRSGIQQGGTVQKEAGAADTLSDPQSFKVAIPMAGGALTNHFGHCEQFLIVDVQKGVIGNKETITPPPHEPGLLPRWLGELNVNLIIAGGMGSRAIELFNQQNIKVVTGAPCLPPEELIQQYLANTLKTGANACDH